MIVYTLFASLKDEDVSPWMIAAEDEFSWEGNPERCEAAFKDANTLAALNGWDVRAIEVDLPYDKIAAAFHRTEVTGEVLS
jgi:hypothetical protein